MNQDFAIDLTPGNARRLVAISRICSMNLDPLLISKAKEGLLDDSAFDPLVCPRTSLRQAATQFIVDCGYRCAVPMLDNTLDRRMILNAVRLSGEEIVTIATNDCRGWSRVINGYKLAKSLKIVPIRSAFDRDANNTVANSDRYAGILVLDYPVAGFSGVPDSMYCAICNDFPRTIIHASPPHIYVATNAGFPWWEMSCALFSTMPDLIFSYSADGIRSVMHYPSWKLSGRDELAILYNTFLPSKMSNYGLNT